MNPLNYMRLHDQSSGNPRQYWTNASNGKIRGTVDQELLLRNEYLVTENRILRNQIKGRVRLSDGELDILTALKGDDSCRL